MATLSKSRFETRGKINPAQWKVFLGNHDISHLVAGMSIVVAPNMPLPVVNLMPAVIDDPAQAANNEGLIAEGFAEMQEASDRR